MAKKIGAIVSLSIIGILIIATIIMANINVNYGVNCANPNNIYVQYDGAKVEATAEQKSKIVNFISNASQEKSLTALFNGRLNNHAKVVSKSGTFSVSSTTFYVTFSYTADQTMKEGNNTFVDGDGKSYKYEELVFVVTDTDGESTFRVYVIADKNESKKYSHYYEVSADYSELHSYLSDTFVIA